MMPFSARIPKRVVHRLSRDDADFVANVLGDVVRRTVGSPRHRPQHRQALSRDLDTVFAKNLGGIVIHGLTLKADFGLCQEAD